MRRGKYGICLAHLFLKDGALVFGCVLFVSSYILRLWLLGLPILTIINLYCRITGFYRILEILLSVLNKVSF
jgi:hypothetical protein